MGENIDDKIKELEQAHLDFISTVSHELRTPLTSIRGFADTLLDSFERLSPEQRIKFLNIIKAQSNRLINLVENLLAVSKLQSDKEILVYKAVSIKPFIEACIQIIKAQYKTHNFLFSYESNMPDILIDTDKFQQIMLNLLDNAAKYSDENSNIEIKLFQLTKEDKISITVKDSGIGISQDDISKIFNKFSRVDSPLTRKIQGSGLGLYITKNLVEKMKGEISVVSDEKGTIFSINFPISKFGEDSEKRIKE